VLELVEGETLAERLGRGPVALAEVVEIARAVAEALEAAHRKGIVHRDLKPSNVKLTPERRVKVLDFGLAKAELGASEPGAGASAGGDTTGTGTILGTAPYMSPEQARGEPADRRADVWAFGCLLYEMLTGTRAFAGRSVTDVLAAVLRDAVDWTRLPPATPPALRRLIERCLRKDQRRRLQDLGDARIELEELGDDEALPAASGGRRQGVATVLPWAIAALAVVAAVLARVLVPAPAAERPAARLQLDPGPGVTLADDYAAPFALSRDGTTLAFVARGRGEPAAEAELFLRALDDAAARPLAGTRGAWQPFFSPDGRFVGFFAQRKLKKLDLATGSVVELAEIGGNPRGAAWGESDRIVLATSQNSGLATLSSSGGTPAPLTQLDEAAGEQSHRWPQVLPGGRDVLFTAASEDGSFDEARLEVVSLASGERRTLFRGGSYGRYVPSGHLLFARAGRLHAVGFDLERMEVVGAPAVVLEGVRYDPRNGGTHLAVSAAEVAVYAPGTPISREHHLVWVGTDGRVTRIGDTPRLFREPRLAPDGRRAAVRIGDAQESELWLLDLASATPTRIGQGLSPHRPVWTPDGRGVTIGVERDARWRLVTVPVAGGEPRALVESEHRIYPSAWSPDGRRLVYQERRPGRGWDLRMLEVEGGRPAGEPRDLLATPFNEQNAALSRDGRWLAYEADELDAIFEVYVRPFGREGPKVRATHVGARWPRWGAPGTLHFWQSFGDGLQEIAYRIEGERFVPLGEAPVWSDTASGRPRGLVVTPAYASYDIDPAGGRFLMLEEIGPSGPPTPRLPVVALGGLLQRPAAAGGAR